MKICNKCKTEKELSEFYQNNFRKGNLQAWCKLCQKRYRQTEKGKEVHRKESRKRWLRYPEKTKAHHAVNHALRDGRLFKEPCKCGETKVQGHHEDYSKPLDVEWLCTKCHNKLETKA